MNGRELVIFGVIFGYASHELHAPFERSLFPFHTPTVSQFQIPGPLDGGESTHGMTRIAQAWEIASVTRAPSASSTWTLETPERGL